MNQTAIKEKIFNIESELEFLKRSFLKEPDFDIDEKNWRKVKSEAKKSRKEVFQRLYGKK
ncbi:MAG: hypothetical protein ABIG08_01505 [bacterium]